MRFSADLHQAHMMVMSNARWTDTVQLGTYPRSNGSGKAKTIVATKADRNSETALDLWWWRR